MASAEFGTGRSIVVLAVVVGCFAVLWPKIFYPMMQTAFSMTAPKTEASDDRPGFGPVRDRPPHLHPGLMNPRLRESMSGGPRAGGGEGRPFPHPSARQPSKPQPKTGGAMSIIMPIYTIGIVVFFLYTVLKLVFKKSDADPKKPLIKDFHMDPEYHKFVCSDAPTKPTFREKSSAPKKLAEKLEPKKIPEKKEEEQLDEKDHEIHKLRKKLEETESAMERIMKHMGAMSECLSKGLPLSSNDALTESKQTFFTVIVPFMELLFFWHIFSSFFGIIAKNGNSTVRQRNPYTDADDDSGEKEKVSCKREQNRKLNKSVKEYLNCCETDTHEEKVECMAEECCGEHGDHSQKETNASCLSDSKKSMLMMESSDLSASTRTSAVECFDDSDSNNDESDDNKDNQSFDSPCARHSPSSFTADTCSEGSLQIDEDPDENMPLLIGETDLNQAKIMCKCGSQ